MKRIFLFVCVVVLALLLPAVLSHAVKIEFTDEALSGAPEKQGLALKASPFEFTPYKFTRQTADRRAGEVFQKSPVVQAVRGRRPEVTETDEEIIYAVRDIRFHVSKTTGGEILLDLERYAVSEPQRGPVDEKRLKAVADSYIREQFRSVNPAELRFSKVKKIMDAQGTMDPQTKVGTLDSPQVANYIFIYERLIKGIPVIGSGEKIRVYFSASGDLIGHSLVWRRLRPGAERAKHVKSSEEIRKIFLDRHGKDPAESIRVDRLYFGYYAEGRYKPQKAIRPYYILGYTYGPHSKRKLERYDAYTGEFIKPPEEKPGSVKK